MNVQTRVAMETSTNSGLAPLQLEARSAFQTSRARRVVAAGFSSAVGLMGQKRGQQQRQSMMMMMSLSRSTSDGYDASGGEDSDQIPQRSIRKSR
ncbi:hypothetical protein Bca52824_016395 [Brassica carinata]|uniref:Uncharacterized protein n=1 Tax=Brassica carinata TaxID=52824 RepID=A0A8X8B6H7_BRACI|nr:hypothetical protein Bca52824_016395 [Brassica carinata]